MYWVHNDHLNSKYIKFSTELFISVTYRGSEKYVFDWSIFLIHIIKLQKIYKLIGNNYLQKLDAFNNGVHVFYLQPTIQSLFNDCN